MKTLRMIMMGVMALVCVTGFVACGDDDDPTPTPTPPTPTPTEKPTSFSATYHFMISADMYKYATFQILDSAGNVVKDLSTADFKAYTDTKQIPDYYKALKTVMDSSYLKNNTTYYECTYSKSYTTFPFSDKYVLKATAGANVPDADAKVNAIKYTNYVTGTGKGTFNWYRIDVSGSYAQGVKGTKWSDYLNRFNSDVLPSKIAFSCDAEGYLTVK